MGRVAVWSRSVASAAALAVASSLLAGCGEGSPAGTVSVLYAGSLAAVMEDGVGPAFRAASGYGLAGEAHGSLGAAHLVRDRLRRPDVFVSADPAVNQSVLMGDGNGNLATWYVTFASSQLVVGYSPTSPFAEEFATRPWYEVLAQPGLRFGRGDPSIDPKGYRTLFLFQLAAEHYGRPELAGLLGGDMNPDQIVPEVALLARVESGQLDAGVFYRHEAVAHDLPYVSLPPEVNLGDAGLADRYARAAYTSPAGELVTGAPILFTATIPRAAADPAGAEALVHFLLTSPDLLERFGFGIVHGIGGDPEQVPPRLRTIAEGPGGP